MKKIFNLIKLLVFIGALGFAFSTAACGVQSGSPIEARHLGLVINASDEQSKALGDYYMKRRNIPADNVIYVRFPSTKATLTQQQFAVLKSQVDKATPSHIQAYALAWTEPYRVDCMSITSAFAFGFSENYCAKDCKPTQQSAYYNSSSHSPWDHHRVRPTMMLAGATLDDVKKMIDRGVKADALYPSGTAYLLSTSDKARNTRSGLYQRAEREFGKRFNVEVLQADILSNKDDIFFYFTGLKQVAGLASLGFLPGAIADHLTSHGGRLTSKKGQMSALRWLEAGATASYGTVVEPCNFIQKFPNPVIVMRNYLNGDSLIEAYWKSVAWPGQGVFVGEPLASPFRLF
jgi:uncharacterized protein (TIGR03790 family)